MLFSASIRSITRRGREDSLENGRGRRREGILLWRKTRKGEEDIFVILESKKEYSRVDHFSTREIKITIYKNLFFWWTLRNSSGNFWWRFSSWEGIKADQDKYLILYILFRLAGQHRKRAGNTVDDNGVRFMEKRQCARIFKNEKKKKIHSFLIFTRQIKPFSDRLVYIILFEKNKRLLRAFHVRQSKKIDRDWTCLLIRSTTKLEGRTKWCTKIRCAFFSNRAIPPLESSY